MHFFNKFTGEYEKLKKELAQPDRNQKKEKFKKENKIACIITNSEYGKTKGKMSNLDAVKDDHKNIR